jgi:predicted transglutaminase-like cysteine proteinase
MTTVLRIWCTLLLLWPTVATATAASRNMQTLGMTSQPIGHYNFCKINPRECSHRSMPGNPMTLTRQAWEAMAEVNSTVNRSIIPLTDQELFGVEEYWTYPAKAGDCEDYVLLKQKKLRQLGFKESDLLITIVTQTDGSGHAVLTVRTNEGDFILDNMNDDIRLWSDTDYTFLKRQSSRNTGRWTKIRDSRPASVGSIRKNH